MTLARFLLRRGLGVACVLPSPLYPLALRRSAMGLCLRRRSIRFLRLSSLADSIAGGVQMCGNPAALRGVQRDGLSIMLVYHVWKPDPFAWGLGEVVYRIRSAIIGRYICVLFPETLSDLLPDDRESKGSKNRES